MSLEDFQLIDNESIDNSIIKRDFIKVYSILSTGSTIERSRSEHRIHLRR